MASSERGNRSSVGRFEVVFVGVMILTILSLAVSVYLAVQHPTPSDEIRRLIETTSTTWKLGFGATIGLIGVKALTP